MEKSLRIAVIGAGAAGVFGAISAASHDRSAEIVILEATHKLLAKVRISGGGRCNVTHHCYDPAELIRHYPRGNKALRGPFDRFQPRDTVAWFKKHGVRLKIEDDGRMFPVTDKSSTIVDCLLQAAAKLKIKIRSNAQVKSVDAIFSKSNFPKFEIGLPDGVRERFDCVLLATGGSSQGHRLAETLGHSIVPCVPSLFTFKVTNPRLEGLAGVSFENVKLTLMTNTKNRLNQMGALLITHWGLSGPAVLQLSAWGARALHESDYRSDLAVNFLPDFDSDQLHQKLLATKDQNGRKRVHNGNVFPVPRRYWRRIVQLAGISAETTWTNMTKSAMTSIISEFTHGRFAINGKGAFKEEFVTCGGVDLKEVDFRTMQSKLCPGLYFAGEILDIDGLTGGFNLQNAWTTSWIAGLSMASGLDFPTKRLNSHN